MMSATGFTLSSFLCGIAPNLGSLIAFRILQGATGGALQPLSQAVLLESFEPHERGKAMGFWGLGIVVAPILGPVRRRLADRQLQLALGVLHQPAGRHRVDRHDEAVHLRPAVPAARDREKIDYWGIGMLVVGIGALQYVLDKGQQEDWFASTAASSCCRSCRRVTLIALIYPRADDRSIRSSICVSSRSAATPPASS